MKTITLFLFSCLLCFGNSLLAQPETSIETLLERLSENHMGSVSDVFSNEELVVLKNHFYQNISTNENSNNLLRRRISSTQAVIPVSVVEINPTDLSELEVTFPSPLTEFEGAGVVRVNPVNGAYIVDNSNKVWIRGIDNGQYTNVGTINAPSGESITGLEYNALGDILFGVSTNGTNSSTLLKINTSTWNATPIGNNNIMLPINLGRDANDDLYTVDIDTDKLFRLSQITGAATLIGDIGFDANFGQGMLFDQFTNKLLMTAFNNSLFDSELREVNVSTGLSTSLGTIVPGTLYQFGWGSMYDKDVLGIEDPVLKDFNFYPNPVTDILNLKSSSPIESIEIYSLLGQKIFDLTINSTSFELNISSLSSGIYVLKIISNGEFGSYKLIKR